MQRCWQTNLFSTILEKFPVQFFDEELKNFKSYEQRCKKSILIKCENLPKSEASIFAELIEMLRCFARDVRHLIREMLEFGSSVSKWVDAFV